MLEMIASNGYYDVSVDVSKNRIYLTIKGYWQAKELVPNYLADVGNAAAMLKPGFTVLANLTRTVPPGREVGSLHLEAQKLLVERGLARSAEVLNDLLLINVASGYPAASQRTRRIFYDAGFAEVWLDSFER
jgi:hypothetical protein